MIVTSLLQDKEDKTKVGMQISKLRKCANFHRCVAQVGVAKAVRLAKNVDKKRYCAPTSSWWLSRAEISNNLEGVELVMSKTKWLIAWNLLMISNDCKANPLKAMRAFLREIRIVLITLSLGNRFL